MNTSEPGLLAAAWRHRWLVLGVIALVVGLALAVSFLRPQETRYSAWTTVVIQEPITAETVSQQNVSVAYLRSQLEILRSPIVAEAAREMVMDNDPEILGPDDALPETSILGSDESPLVSVNTVAPEPDLAVSYVNAVAEAYREVSQRQATSTSEAQLAHIDAQVEGIDERLREIELGIAGLVAEDSDLAALQAQAEEAVTAIAGLQTTLVSGELSDEEAATIRQRIQDHRQVITVYGDVLARTATNPERRALAEEQTRQVDRRARLLTLRDEIAVNVGLVAPDSIALVQPAFTAVQLPGVDLARVLAVALLIGVAAGLGLAHLLSVSRKTFTGRAEPGPVLGAPLLADVPDFEEEGITSPVPVRDSPRSAAAEAYRFASATLGVAALGHSARSIFVASSTHRRGKTTTVVNTAMAAAANDRSVLVLDCDFGNQEATRLLVGEDHGSLLGVTDIIQGQAMAKEATHVVEVNGASLHVMPRGTRPSLAATVLQSKDARDLITLLTGVYDLVIIDGPPMLQVAYASTLAGLADGVVVVVENRSRHSELVEMKGRLDLVGTPVLGYVYNRSPLRREMTVTEGSMMDILGDGGLMEQTHVGHRETG